MALPLEGVRVLDPSSAKAGPHCTLVLGESYCFAVPNRNKAGDNAAAQVTAGVGAE